MNLDFFNTRRTVRSFSPEVPSRDDICAMIEAAAHAPNTGNMQNVAAIVTSDSEILRQLSPLHFGQPCVCNAPYVITFCADFNRFEQWCSLRDANPGFDNLQSLLAAIVDASIFAQQFCTIAEMNGLGGVFLGTTLYNAGQIARVLELPDKVIPVITLAIGVPASDAPQGPTERLPLRSVLHLDKYQPFDNNDIESLYATLEAAESSHKFVAENNKKTLAQLFSDVRYPRDSAEDFSNTLKEFIKIYL